MGYDGRSGPASEVDAARSATVSVAVGERPALLLTALAGLLEGSGLDVRGRATSAPALERAVRRDPPDVILVDAALGNGGQPLSFVEDLQQPSSGSALVVLVDELTPVTRCSRRRAATNRLVTLKGLPISKGVDVSVSLSS